MMSYINFLNQPIVAKALGFATAAHHGQLRKYSGEKYVTHVREVADLTYSSLCRYDLSHLYSCDDWLERVYAIAILHDVVEDCNIDHDTLRCVFGGFVASRVGKLTKVKCETRQETNRVYNEQLSESDIFVQTIKTADIISNLKSIAKNDPEFAKIYFPEKQETLKILTEADPLLLEIAWGLVNSYFAKSE